MKMHCTKMALGEFDASGRRRPAPIEGSQFTRDYDTIIAAIGQAPEIPNEFGLATGRGNALEADFDTTATAREGVFAGGDCVTGPASVIEAIAAGRRGGMSIDKYLGGNGVIDEALAAEQETAVEPPASEEEAEEHYRPPTSSLPLSRRLCGFGEVDLGFSPECAVAESNRCLRCDLEER